MKRIRTDVAVIGAGSAGLSAFRAAAQYTDKVVLIESGPYGTTCARVGCMPSKLLIAAAEAAHTAQQAHRFGMDVAAVQVDGARVMSRVRRERDRFVGFVLEGVDNIDPAQRLRGHARFLSPHCLQLDTHTQIEASRIVIATGSTPTYPQAWQALGNRLVVNDDVFDWTDLPQRVAVVGSGIIGLELGQALARLGVEVTLLGRGGRLGPISDPAVLEAASRSLGAEFGPQFSARIDAQVLDLQRHGDQVHVRFRDARGLTQQLEVDYLIAATGRRPNLAGLNLEDSGLNLNGQGIPLFDRHTLRAGTSHIFIAGDVTAEDTLLHEAADEGRIAGDNAGRYPNVQPGLRRTPLTVVFSDPQIAMTGRRWADLDPRDIVVGEVSFENQGRSRVMLQNRGLLRVYVSRSSGVLLGAEMVGPRAEHLAHLLAWAQQAGHSVDTLLEMPFYHPVVEEGLRTALRDAAQQRRKTRSQAA